MKKVISFSQITNLYSKYSEMQAWPARRSLPRRKSRINVDWIPDYARMTQGVFLHCLNTRWLTNFFSFLISRNGITIALLLMTTIQTQAMNQEFAPDKQETKLPSPLHIPRRLSQDFSAENVKSLSSPYSMDTAQETLAEKQKSNNNCRRLTVSYCIMGAAVITTLISSDVVLTYFNK